MKNPFKRSEAAPPTTPTGPKDELTFSQAGIQHGNMAAATAAANIAIGIISRGFGGCEDRKPYPDESIYQWRVAQRGRLWVGVKGRDRLVIRDARGASLSRTGGELGGFRGIS